MTGSGDLDPSFVLEELPKMLVLPERKVQQTVKELVSSRKRMLLVQAVSTMRQRRPAETVRGGREGRQREGGRGE